MHLKIGKTTLQLTFSFAAIITLMLLLCDEEIVLISLFSSLFHEGGHLFFMLAFSCAPRFVSFGAFGIRIERYEDSLLNYKKEAAVALGGVMGNAVLAFFGLCFYLFYKSTFALKFLAVNLFIAVFNLIPIRHLDAGRCIEAVLDSHLTAEKANKVFALISASTCVVLAVICVLYNIFFGFNVSFIAVTVYLIFISNFKEFKNDK